MKRQPLLSKACLDNSRKKKDQLFLPVFLTNGDTEWLHTVKNHGL